MKVGDKIIIKKNVTLRNVNGTIVSSIPGKTPKAYVVKAHSEETVLFVLKVSEFSRIEGQENVNFLGDYFFIEQGSDGKVVNVLPHSRYFMRI